MLQAQDEALEPLLMDLGQEPKPNQKPVSTGHPDPS